MHRGRMLRIILVILILGMGTFLLVRNSVLQKKLDQGEITQITPKDFLPFGAGAGENVKDFFNDIVNRDDDNYVPPKKHLLEIAGGVAGMKIILIPDEIAGTKDYIPAVRYVAQENGYVYDYVPKYKKSYLRSDTPIPKVSYAYFSQDGNTILMRYLDEDLFTEKSVLGTMGESEVLLLPDNMPGFAFGPGGRFAYIKYSAEGVSFILRKSDKKEETVYSSPLSEWNLDFMGQDRLLLTTKASELAPGFAYILDLNTKKTSRLWNNTPGLTTKVSPLGGYILKAETISSGPILSLYNVRTSSLNKIDKMGMVEKCAFRDDDTAFACALPKSFESKLYPDSWYTGEVSTSDEIAQYTTENLNERIYSSINIESGRDMNIWSLSIDNSGNFAAFIDRNNMSLWLYEE